MNSSMEAKIAALLAKAERTDNEHEREAFSRKAEELMLRYGIEEAMARAASPDEKIRDEPVITRKLRLSGSYVTGLIDLANSVTRGLGDIRGMRAPVFDYVNGPYGLRYGKKQGHFDWLMVGTASDLDRAETLIRSIIAQSEAAMKIWWGREGRAITDALGKQQAKYARYQFHIGFGHAVGLRLKEVRAKMVEETTGAELVLVDAKARVDAVAAGLIGRKVRPAPGVIGGSAGRKAGESADLGFGKVGDEGREELGA